MIAGAGSAVAAAPGADPPADGMRWPGDQRAAAVGVESLVGEEAVGVESAEPVSRGCGQAAGALSRDDDVGSGWDVRRRRVRGSCAQCHGNGRARPNGAFAHLRRSHTFTASKERDRGGRPRETLDG